MATALSALINRTRRYTRDWPDLDTTTASVASNGTSLSVVATASDRYSANSILQMGQEALLITAVASATSLTVRRAMMGSTAASYPSGTSILNRPAFLDLDYIDALNASLDATWPLLYKPVLDTSLTALANTYEYTVPNMPSTSTPIQILSHIEIKEVGDFAYRPTRRWTIQRGATPKIKFREVPTPGATIRVHGYGPFSHLTAITDSLDAQYPLQAESLLPVYAAGWLLQSGEAGRVRTDTGTIDGRENANRVGSSIQAGAALINRFRLELNVTALPPVPRHCVSVF